MKRFLALLACLCLLVSSAFAEDTQTWIDKELTQGAGTGSEWYILALSQTGAYDFTAYRAALLDYLDTHRVTSATSRQKYALALLATGGTDAFVAAAMEDTIGQQGIMSDVFGLHLLNNGCTSSAHTADSVAGQLLSLQLEDGGWAVTGAVSDVDVTAMVLQALAPHQATPRVAQATQAALALLSARQLADGDFSSYGVANAESTAQVLIALCCLGIDCTKDARFVKNGCTLLDGLNRYRLEDGYRHTLDREWNATASAQGFLAQGAWQRLQAGQGSIYLLDGHPAPMGWQAIAAMSIAGAAAIACLALARLRKRSWKNYAAVALAAAALVIGVFSLDIQSAGSYYTPEATTQAEVIGTVRLSIRCDTVAGLAEHIPADGIILAEAAFPLARGDTVLDVLTRAAKASGLRMDVSGSGYVAGIQYLYEFDFGNLSGWMYQVNGETAGVGCNQYLLQDGDTITWRYTCSMGSDL